jgi:hypothetical protein
MHPAFLVNQMIHHRMTRSRIVLPPRPQLQNIVHEVVTATTDAAQLKQVIEELQGLRDDFAQERAERALQESPYSGLLRFAPKTKDEWYNFVTLVLTALAILLTLINKPEAPTVVVDMHEQEIVEQLKQINERLAERDSTEDTRPPSQHC